MSLIQLKNASILFGQPPLIDKADFVLQANERVCLVGRNGCGKSTFLQAISGEIKLDDGQRIVDKQVKISRLAQDPPTNTDISLFDYIAEGLSEDTKLVKDYFTQINLVAEDSSEQNLNKLQRLQELLEANNAWHLEQKISNVLTQLGLDGSTNLKGLSGGWRRKAALARALVSEPQILLLDEPTNHLDIDMVKWLETNLLNFQGALVFISHDRAFIRKLATRIVDIDRGQLTSYPGNYEQYLVQKAHDLEVQATHDREFDKKLANEETWIRQGIKARRTRNEGRVRALKALREEYKARRQVTGSAKVSVGEGSRSGKRVFELTNVSYSIDGKTIVNDLNLLINRGDKLALVGPNGCGKTTLIKILLGELTPQQGEVYTGTNLDIAYFDQHRRQLPLDKPLIDVIGDGKREVEVNGKPRHVISYLQEYLFSPERVNAPVSTLSGGEKNRLMLAKLMLRPSNLLILDEPTNDLDVETLELLESLLVEYKGTVLLVSHDRDFIDNVVSSSLFFEKQGHLSQFVGGYSEIENWYNSKVASPTSSTDAKITKKASKPSKVNVSVKKLSYKEQQELNRLPELLERLETEVEELQQTVNQNGFFSQQIEITQPILDKLTEQESALEQAMERWEELESKQQG